MAKQKYYPSDYAKSVPAKVRGTRSTEGVTIIHTSMNRAERRKEASIKRHTEYEHITHNIIRVGERSKRKKEAKAQFRETQRAQRLIESNRRANQRRKNQENGTITTG